MVRAVTAARVVENTGRCWKVEVTAHPNDWTGLYESHDDGATWTTQGLWLVSHQMLEGLRAVIQGYREDHAGPPKLWAVYNGFQRDGSCAVVVEAATADEAIDQAVKAFMANDPHDPLWFSRPRMSAEPFELGKVVDLG